MLCSCFDRLGVFAIGRARASKTVKKGKRSLHVVFWTSKRTILLLLFLYEMREFERFFYSSLKHESNLIVIIMFF